jgi:hypothetical protein
MHEVAEVDNSQQNAESKEQVLESSFQMCCLSRTPLPLRVRLDRGFSRALLLFSWLFGLNYVWQVVLLTLMVLCPLLCYFN